MKSPRTVCVSKRTSVLGMRNAAKYLCAGTNILKNCQTLGTLFEQQQRATKYVAEEPYLASFPRVPSTPTTRPVRDSLLLSSNIVINNAK